MLPMLRNRFVVPALFEPWSDLRREIDRVFDSALTGQSFGSDRQPTYMPAMDIEETSDRIRLSLEIPGVSPEDLNVAIENKVLTVSGEKRFERKNGEQGSALLERRYGRFERSVMLPESVDTDDIVAHFENGVLTIDLPRNERSRRRTIAIGLGAEKHRQNGQKQLDSAATGPAESWQTAAEAEGQRERQLT
jgi:HSP20 family protein